MNLLGLLWKAQGRFKEAEALHRRAIQVIPQAGGFHNNLGRLLWRSGEFRAALDAIEAGVRAAGRRADLLPG